MKRRTSAWLACLLVIAQMVLGPVAHPMTAAAVSGPCAHASGASSCGDDCGHCPSHTDQAPVGPHHGHGGAPTHARCSCSCAHTPVLAMTSLPLLQAGTRFIRGDDPSGPSLSSPLFSFLRPPN